MKLISLDELRTSIDEIESTIALYSNPNPSGSATPGGASDAARSTSPAALSRSASPVGSHASSLRRAAVAAAAAAAIAGDTASTAAVAQPDEGMRILELVQRRWRERERGEGGARGRGRGGSGRDGGL